MGSTAATRTRARTPLFWPLLALLLALVLVGVGIFALVRATADQEDYTTRNSQVIQSITREQQVVLLSLGIQGIMERSQDSHLFGLENLPIPWSERASFIQYEFTAKLGHDGAEVQIDELGENRFRITVPEFEFIGHSDEQFKVAAEDNGVLSWITAPIDPVQMVNDILSDSTKDEYVEKNQDLLQDQAEAFYNGILQGIDPEITAEYVFR